MRTCHDSWGLAPKTGCWKTSRYHPERMVLTQTLARKRTPSIRHTLSPARSPSLQEFAMPLRLGMLGMWHTHADGLVRQMAEYPKEFTLVGGYDPEAPVVAQRRKAWGPRLGGNLRVFDKPEQLLQEQLDGVVVEGRVHDNVRMARLALEANKPVLLEKPAGDNLEDFRRLVDEAQRKHLHVQM